MIHERDQPATNQRHHDMIYCVTEHILCSLTRQTMSWCRWLVAGCSRSWIMVFFRQRCSHTAPRGNSRQRQCRKCSISASFCQI